METTMSNLHPDTSVPVDETPQPNAVRPAPRVGRPGDDVVRWAEFRLALWIGGVALAVIISSQGLLYSAILDLKGDIGGLQGEIGNLRADMQTQIGDLRREMQTQFGELRERIVGIETHLGMDAGSVEKAN